jgi:PAS domain S-box-containing protein
MEKKLAKDTRETRGNEERYSDLFLNLPDGVLVHDADGVILEANESVARRLEVPREALAGRNMAEFLVPDSGPVAAARAASILAGEDQTREVTCVSVSGKKTPADLHQRSIDWDGGHAVLSVLHDITERKRVREVLAKLARFPNENPNPVLRVSRAGLVEYSNPASAALLKNWGHRAGNPLPERWRDVVQASLGTDTPQQIEAEYDGRTVSLTFAPAKATDTVNVYGLDITERKQAERALQTRNAIFAIQQEASLDGILVVDEDARINWFSRRFVDIWGIPEELVKNRIDGPVLQHVAVQLADPQAFVQRVHDLYEHRQETSHEELALADGRVVDRYTAPVLGPEGQYHGRVWFFRDISESKQAQAALRASETRYRRLFEAAKDGILILDAETGMVTDANPFLVELLGYSREAFLGKAVWELGFLRNIVANRDKFEELQRQEYVRYEDLPLRTVDGRQIDVEFVSNVYLADDRRVIQCNIRDISERTRAEDELRLGYARESVINEILRLTLAEAPLDSLLDQALGLVLGMREFAVEPRGAIFLMEGVPETLALKAQRNLPPSLLTECARVPFGKCLCGRAAATGQVQFADGIDERHDVRYDDMQPHGHYCAPMRVGERTVGVVNFYVQAGEARSTKLEAFTIAVANALAGVVSRKRSEEEQNKLELQLNQAQKMDAVGCLAGGVAHDFNNKLMAILGYAELCQIELEEGTSVREYVDEIAQAARQSADLTRQLLAFARKQTIQPQVLDLNETVAGMLKMLQRLIGEHIRLVWQPGPGLWPVSMDPGQVDQILANLAVNGRDAITGTGLIKVETENQVVDEAYAQCRADAALGMYVVLAVSDDGCGMGGDVLARLFEPFFTTKPIGKGTGLGLATVYGIVRQNRGFITVYSSPGQGSTFRIHLPRSHDGGGGDNVKETESAQATLRGTETVLLVEDEEQLLRSARLLLEELGYIVRATSSASRAIELVRAHPEGFDLLLTDVVMPAMNGRELHQQLRALCPSLRCIYMSGYTADIIAREGVLDQDTHFLQKPFSLDQLGLKLREALDRPRAQS